VSKTRLYVECPNCHMQYMVKDFGLTYSNGARIEDIDDPAAFQRLVCPCNPRQPTKFKLRERVRIHVFPDNDPERTHFSLAPRKYAIQTSLEIS